MDQPASPLHALDYLDGNHSCDVKVAKRKSQKRQFAELGQNIESDINELTAIQIDYGENEDVRDILKIIEGKLSAAATQH